MSTEKQELINSIETLPEEFTNKVIEYIEYLKFVAITNNAPEELIIKDKEDLVKKLEEGIKDTENGDVCTLEEVFSDIEKCL